MIHGIDRKLRVASFNKFYDKIFVGSCLNPGKQLFAELSFYKVQEISKNTPGSKIVIFFLTITLDFECL